MERKYKAREGIKEAYKGGRGEEGETLRMRLNEGGKKERGEQTNAKGEVK